MEVIKGVGQVVQEGSKWAKEGRHVFKDIKKGFKKAIKKKQQTTTQKMMRPSSVSWKGEVKRVDLKLDAGTNLVAIANVVGLQDFTAGFVCCNLMQQGVADYQRIANKITVYQTMITCELVKNANSNQTVRSLVVFDSDPNGAYPLLSSILSTVDQVGGTNTGFNSGMNTHNTGRFRILRNKTYVLSDATTPTKVIKYVIKNKYDCQYNGTANPLTIASVLKGAVYWIFFYSGANAPQIQNTYIRTKFYDK